MENKRSLLFFFIISIYITLGQSLNWQDISNKYDLPSSVHIFQAERSQPALKIYYMDVNLNSEDIVVRPYLSSNKANVKSLADNFGAFAAINGGYFGNSVSYSAVIYPEKVKARNVSALTRDGKSYPVIRSLFSLSQDYHCSVDWIYHFSGKIDDIYAYDSPLPYSYNDSEPLSAPKKSEGSQMDSILTGIGGGPTLVKNGEKHITYNEEIFWGSGVGRDNRDPRTAVGYTDNNHIILVTADGRQDHSKGLELGELAEIMIDLGCVEAVNLDGGGSTQMAVPDEFVNAPSENRAVPSILAVTHRDSLYDSDSNGYERIIDTEDNQCQLIGDWFETSNAGFYGDTPSQLSKKGAGDDVAKYKLGVSSPKTFKIYSWWVAADNRCKDTPYVFIYEGGRDTVRVDQTSNHGTWNYLGEYTFSSGRDSVLISDAATSGTYVVADAIALEEAKTQIEYEHNLSSKDNITMINNFPNPFNNLTTIQFKVNKTALIDLDVYNIKGQHVEQLVNNKVFSPGLHTLDFNSQGLASGIYFLTLKSADNIYRKKMLLIK